MNGWYTGRAVDSGCLEPTASARRRLLVHREFCCEDLTWAHSSAPSGLGAFVHRRKGSAPLRGQMAGSASNSKMVGRSYFVEKQ